jgi:hypothetical protein
MKSTFATRTRKILAALALAVAAAVTVAVSATLAGPAPVEHLAEFDTTP